MVVRDVAAAADAARAVAPLVDVLRAAIVSLQGSASPHQASVSRVALLASVTATSRVVPLASVTAISRAALLANVTVINRAVLLATAAIRVVSPAMALSRVALLATAAIHVVFPAMALSRAALPVSVRRRDATISLPAIVNSAFCKRLPQGSRFFIRLRKKRRFR